MASATIFRGFNNPVENKSLVLLTKDIKEGKYRQEVERVTQLVTAGNLDEADKLKKQLPAFTPSGTFDGGRKLEFLVQYSQYIVLDLDKLSQEQLQPAFEKAAAIPYTFCCFRSPSGNGLKIVVEVTSTQEHHQQAYKQVADYYEQQIGLPIDRSGKDITRLCFVSYDPQAHRNISNEKFPVTINGTVQKEKEQPPTTAKPKAPAKEPNKYALAFEMQISFTNQKSEYGPNNRNNYIYLLASNCNRAGIPEQDTLELCLQKFDLTASEVTASVKSAYQHHAGEFAKFAKKANLQSEHQATDQDEEHDLEDYLKTTPTIPDHVFDALPDILKEGAKAFSDKRKRDVFFTGAIAIISGCLPKVTGVYFQERVYPHLYTFIIAPPASGKGVLKNAKRLADKYHQQVLERSREEQKKHELEMLDFKEQQRTKKKEEPAPEKPEAPPFKIVFIPADCSQSRMVEHLQQNDGQGIICETEADTMSGAKKQDWGDYSPILRAAFHHEKIAISRKTNNEYVEINEPSLAVTLSGTPAQAPKLISSAEDGLFSRFLFYAFKNEVEWQDPSPKSHTVVFNDHFDALASQVLQQIGFLERSETEIQLYPEQWEILNNTFSQMLSEVTIFTSEEASGVVYRLGLILFRFCMIFSALRKCENAEAASVVYCTYEDFNTALTIVQTYLQHSLLMFNNLPRQNDFVEFQSGDSKRRFFDALPAEFTRKQAVELSAPFKLAPRTVDAILKSGLGKTVQKLKAGLYQKI